MQIVQKYGDEIERLIRLEMERPGLTPRWSSSCARAALPAQLLASVDALVADPTALAQQPASAWPPDLLECWRLGFVFLRDERSRIADSVAIGARRLIIRESTIGPFSSFEGDRLLIAHTTLSGHAAVHGPLALVQSGFRQQVALGPYVIITRSSSEAFVKVARFVRVDKSLLAAGCAIEGSTHADQVPLGERKRKLGIAIGPDCWLGQHVSVTNGAIVGRGVMVAPHTSITTPTSEFVFVSGTPPREFPIDFNIRGLSADEALKEGQAQGIMAISLPVFGAHRSSFVRPNRLEIDYPEHGCIRGIASENLLHFQRGVLMTALPQFLPGPQIDVRFDVGQTVRFAIDFDRAVATELTVPGRAHAGLFAPGKDAGMFAAHAEPKYLAQLWNWLLNFGGPLPPFVPAAPQRRVAAASAAASDDAAVVQADTQSIVTGLIRRLIARKEPIDADTPFHALGIDSILGVQLAVNIEAHFNIAAPDVFRHNTVRKLAQVIAQSPRL